MSKTNFAETLKELIEQTGIKPEALGRELEIIPSTVKRWMNGTAEPMSGVQKFVIRLLKKKLKAQEK